MRFALSLSALLLTSTAALAEDILIRADISAATVFASGAEVTRSTTVTIPAGEHRVLIAMPDALQADLVQVVGPDGLTLGLPQILTGYTIGEGTLDDPVQAAARAAVDSARDAVETAQDDLTLADTAMRALEVQLAYLTALTRGDENGVALPTDPALVSQFLATLGAETARVQTEMQAARVARRALATALEDRQAELNAATEALARLRPFAQAVDVMEVAVQADAPIEADLALSYLTYNAGWEPGYELHLDSETGAVAVDRFIHVHAAGPARWQGVDMVFSTATPTRDRTPSNLSPSAARIIEPAPAPSPVAGLLTRDAEAFAETAGMIEPAIVMEDSGFRAQMQVQGLSVSYDYTTPVSIGPSGTATLPFDALTLEAEMENRAVPRHDDTAFLVAMAQNDSGETILPGPARFYRDGSLVGEDMLPLIAQGEEVEIAFGPLDHLQLIWIDRSLAEGDRGIFVSSDTQARAVGFGVENTSDAVEAVRVLYATPFAEQEDLELDLTLSPQPSERDIDDLRGVHAWDLQVGPGQTEMIEMQVEFSWPEGQILNWRP